MEEVNVEGKNADSSGFPSFICFSASFSSPWLSVVTSFCSSISFSVSFWMCSCSPCCCCWANSISTERFRLFEIGKGIEERKVVEDVKDDDEEEEI